MRRSPRILAADAPASVSPINFVLYARPVVADALNAVGREHAATRFTVFRAVLTWWATMAQAAKPVVERAAESVASVRLAPFEGDDALQEQSRAVYARLWREFCTWCVGRNLCPLPAREETLCGYIEHLAATGKSRSTVHVALAALAKAHAAVEYDLPSSARLRALVKSHPETRRRAVTLEGLRAMVATCTDNRLGRRDRALLLLVHHALALPRRHVCRLNIEHCERVAEGYRVSPPGRPAFILPPDADAGLCAVRALDHWLAVRCGATRTEGPLFVSLPGCGVRLGQRIGPSDVYRVTQRRAKAAKADAMQASQGQREDMIEEGGRT